MVSLQDYGGREQSYVKHVFLESYLELLVHKTASKYDHIVYVDGFAGPWRSANEKFEDTSFGIALNALRRAKASWKNQGRDVKMSAYLVERDAKAYQKLAAVPAEYPDVEIKTYEADFLDVLPAILTDTPVNAFAFFFVDPKGWSIPLQKLAGLLIRDNSEVIFNFMFDFINRAASIAHPAVVAGLDELIPYGDWRSKLAAAEKASNGNLSANERKAILVEAFGESLSQLGNYPYVAETTVLRVLSDRALYCLFYATRHTRGIEVFRDCQIKALEQQAATRAAAKIKHAAKSTGQNELFESLHDMGPDEVQTFLRRERENAEKTILELTPQEPDHILCRELWPLILARHVVRLTDVNQTAARMRGDSQIIFPNWEKGKRVPHPEYKMQRPTTAPMKTTLF
jgi:three-Cys-motif partner protein